MTPAERWTAWWVVFTLPITVLVGGVVWYGIANGMLADDVGAGVVLGLLSLIAGGAAATVRTR